jgi:hypothetical protein
MHAFVLPTSSSWFRACCFVLLACAARAQSFNVDCGENPTFSPLPNPTYGGALARTGFWNVARLNAGGTVTSTTMFDVQGVSYPATIQTIAGSAIEFAVNNQSTQGGNAALLDDLFDISGIGATLTFRFSNLINGEYEILTYAWAPDAPAGHTLVHVSNSSSPDQLIGGQWPGSLVEGAIYSRHLAHVSDGVIDIELLPVGLFASVNGIQLIQLDGGARGYCFGDGTASACPCGNAGAQGHGCGNSFFPAGARLSGAGMASVSADLLVLSATNLPDAPTTLFQGTIPAVGGNGVPFGDGLRCAVGTNLRIATLPVTGNAVQYPLAGDPPISVTGGLTAVGGTRFYQMRYRNAASFCTPAAYNLTNGVQVLWTP